MKGLKMISEYKKFYNMIDRFPRVAYLWDRKSHNLDVDAFENDLGVMSSGEVFMAKFFASVWFNRNERYGFDIIDRWWVLDQDSKQIVLDWLADPFYP